MSNGQSILSTIKVGSQLNFQLERRDDNIMSYSYKRVAFVGVDAWSETYTVTAYAYDGGDEAKLSLQSPAGTFWIPVPEAAGRQYPIILGPDAGEFVLTDVGDITVVIRTTFSPPAPYIGFGDRGLSYGLDRADAIRFGVTVT